MRAVVGYGIKYWIRRVAVVALALIPAGCPAPKPSPSEAPPIPPGEARLWFYRTPDFSVSRNLANIDLNGVRVLSLPPYGSALYYDVQPGNYQITVENFGIEANNSSTVTVAPGQEIFAQIVVSETFLSGGGGQGVHRDAFLVKLTSPAASAIAAEPNPATTPPPPQTATAPASPIVRDRLVIRFDDKMAALTPSGIRAFNEAVAAAKRGKPIQLAIEGCEPGTYFPNGSPCARRLYSIEHLLKKAGIKNPRRLFDDLH